MRCSKKPTYSITSSARPSSGSGIFRPSALAVLRLITNSNLSGCCTGSSAGHIGMFAKGHVWTAPSWQGLSSRTQHWSVQPCVRPVDAVHMTAGHNALRGSGPGQKRAFDNALALVGCPDRRIDRLCITCCLPSQPFTSHRMSDAISFTPRARRVLCSVRP